MFEALRVIGALLLVFFLPGMMLVQLLFPRQGELDADFDWLYRLALAIGLSMVITILMSFGLNSLGVNPETGMGYVTAGPITLALVLVTLIFFGLAWYRGGMGFMGNLHPKLIRFPSPDPRDEDIPHLADRQNRFRHKQLVDKKFQILKKIDKTERMMGAHRGEQKQYYRQLRKKQLEELADIEEQISKIEKGLPEITKEGIDIDYMEVGLDE